VHYKNASCYHESHYLKNCRMTTLVDHQKIDKVIDELHSGVSYSLSCFNAASIFFSSAFGIWKQQSAEDMTFTHTSVS